MTEIVLKGKSYFLPSKWEELTSDQYLFLLDLLNEHMHNKVATNTVSINFAMYVLGIKKHHHMSIKQSELFYENLAWLADKTAFWWVVKFENPEVLDHIDIALRRQLKTNLPEELPQTPEMRVLCRYKKWLEPNFVFASNLIPTLKNTPGYCFDMEDGLLSTTLSAGQFSDAMTIAGQYGDTKNAELLNLLCAILYPPKGNYDFNSSKTFAPNYTKVSIRKKQAVYINFNAVLTFLTQQTKFAILFKLSNQKQAEISVGFNNNIYTLSKNGYGNTDNLTSTNLVVFFDLMLKELIDAVKKMQSTKMDIDDILKYTGLTLTQLKLIAP